MKLISWNVNGIRACVQKGFLEFFREADADIFCLQETKLQEGQIDLNLPGYHQYWNYAEKKGYSGTAIFTKAEPLRVTYGIGVEEHDHEGRVITAEYPEFYFVTVYVPNAQQELKRLDYRMQWEADFLTYLKKLEEKKPVIYAGDLNVAHEEIDLKNPKTNRGNAGFTDEERAYCLAKPHPHPHLAARFAAKEAISKCFTTGIGAELNWRSMSIYHGARMEPLVRLDEKGQALLRHVGATQRESGIGNHARRRRGRHACRRCCARNRRQRARRIRSAQRT